jgi:hypothetical protein
MSFEAKTRQQVQILADALTGRLANTVRSELDALRAALDGCAGTLQENLAEANRGPLLEGLVKELSTASRQQADALAAQARLEAEALAAQAREQAEALAAQARLEAEKVAAQQLAAARADAASQLEVAEAGNAALLAKLGEAQGKLVEAQARLGETRGQLDDAHGRLQSVQAETAALREERDELLAAGRESLVLLETEKQRAAGMATALEGAVRDASQAQLDAKNQREALKAANERAKAIEARAQALEAQRAETPERPDSVPLDRIAFALQTLAHATTPSEIFATLLEEVGHDFARTAIFLVGADGFRSWHARGFASGDLRGPAIPSSVAALLARAASERQTVPGDSGGAIPIIAGGQVFAIVYADEPNGAEAALPMASFRIAELLADQVGRRVGTKSSSDAKPQEAATPGSAFSPERTARRVRMQTDVDVTVNGSASSLVDLSKVGAQVLSPAALKPNRVASMRIVHGDDILECKGRIVWVLFERQKGTAAALYRAGIEFTEKEVDAHAIETLIALQGLAGQAPGQPQSVPVLKGT